MLYALLSYFVWQNLKIKGAYYEKIIDGKNIIADILPPPAYIIESYLLSFLFPLFVQHISKGFLGGFIE